MSNNNLETFPKNRAQALTMLYLEKQDISHLTPEQLVKEYLEVNGKINKALSESVKF